MIDEEVWKNYAQAVLCVARDENRVDAVGREITLFAGAYGQNEGMRRLLQAPLIKNAEKKRIIVDIGKILGLSTLSTNFFKLLIDWKRIRYAGQIAMEYRKIADREAQRETAYVKCTIPLSDSQQARLKDILERLSGQKVKLEIEVDEDIIAGMVARVGDKLYEGSAKGEIEALERVLTEGED